MKRVLIGMAVLLAACGGAGTDAPSTTSTTGGTTTTTVLATGETTTTTGPTTTTTASVGSGLLVIAAVDFEGGTYTLRNDGGAAIDLSGFFACNRPSYVELPAAVVEPGATLDISTGGLSLSADDGELGIYNSQSFSSASAIQAYVQWGSDGHGRTGTAVDGGVWTAGEFVANDGSSIVSSGSNPITAADWATGS